MAVSPSEAFPCAAVGGAVGILVAGLSLTVVEIASEAVAVSPSEAFP